MKPCIYMVDDEPDFQTIVHSWLEPLYDVVPLKNGDELLGALRARSPDLVILDLRLPGAGGFDICRRLRSTPGQEAVPVLFLTASQDAADFRGSINAGGGGFLMKPIGRRQLLAAVDELLGENRVVGALAADAGGED
ncbi:MAG: response regulator [Elusimicrobia bacterium]|nr:response regulator [Elusimicrobiota bacterium]